jgi:hypothetical protein
MLGGARDAGDSTAVYMELSFRPSVRLVSAVRRFVSDFYEEMLGDPDGTSRVALVTHELLENAARYSADGETSLRIDLLDDRTPRAIRIRSKNRSSAEHIASLRALIEGLNGADKPEDFYQMAMVRTAKKKGVSGLGLARVCVEGEMKISYGIDGDQVMVEAETVITGGRDA